MVAHDAGGERVVGVDETSSPDSSCSSVERETDTVLQLVGGLVREREAEDLRRRERLGLERPRDASGHHRGLAGAGPHDQVDRLERVADRAPLLVGGLVALEGGPDGG